MKISSPLFRILLLAGSLCSVMSCKSSTSADQSSFNLQRSFTLPVSGNSPINQDMMSGMSINLTAAELSAHNTSLANITSVKLTQLALLNYNLDPRETALQDDFISLLKLDANQTLLLGSYTPTGSTMTSAEMAPYATNPGDEFTIHYTLKRSPNFDLTANFSYVLTITATPN